MLRIIGDVRPAWAIIENVSALRSKGLTLVLQNLCEIGYLCQWHCIPASAVGAHHQRDRIWIIAHCDTNSYGKPTMSEHDEARRLQEYDRDTDGGNGRTVGEVQGRQDSKPCGICEEVANSMQQHKTQRGEREITESQGDGGGTEQGRSEGDAERQRSLRGTGCDPCDEVANPDSERLQGHSEELGGSCEVRTQETPRLLSGCRLSDFWAVEPNVGRVAHGIPNRVDRLKQLGNSVVPQIPELIGNAILEII